MTLECCDSTSNFPNTCLIGPCGCSLDDSKETAYATAAKESVSMAPSRVDISNAPCRPDGSYCTLGSQCCSGSCQSFECTSGSEKKPDLVVSRISFSKNPCKIGDDVQIIFDVTNQGTGSAAPCVDCLSMDGQKVQSFDSRGLPNGGKLDPV